MCGNVRYNTRLLYTHISSTRAWVSSCVGMCDTTRDCCKTLYSNVSRSTHIKYPWLNYYLYTRRGILQCHCYLTATVNTFILGNATFNGLVNICATASNAYLQIREDVSIKMTLYLSMCKVRLLKCKYVSLFEWF